MRADVVEAGSGLFLVVGPRTNWCLIRDGDAITLVDAAWPRDYALVVDSLSQIGAAPTQVEAVVLTHAHPDHLGTAERLRAEHGATIHTHRAEVGHALGQYKERVRTIDLIVRLWRPAVLALAVTGIPKGGLRPTAAAQVEAFDGGPLDVPGKLTAVPTPGHTSGHCSYLLPGQGAVITGDALVNRNLLTGRAGPCLMPEIFTHDSAQAAASLDNLADLDAEQILPGHGELLRMTPAEAVEQAKQAARS